jgi:hypothetical protein
MQRYRKVFEATVEVRNPINFAADTDRHLLVALRGTYAGRCYKGTYVVEVLEIRRRSPCHLSRSNGSAEGYIDVEFLAEVAVFSQWDILVGVEVVNNAPMIVGTYGPPLQGGAGEQPRPSAGARAIVSLRASKASEAIAVGQKIPVRVLVVSHVPMQPQASVVGALLTCDQAAPVYRLRGALDVAARLELEPMLTAIEAELGARAILAETRKADLWFFELLLHAHREARPGPARPDQALPAWPGGPVWAGPAAPGGEGGPVQSVLEIAHRVVRSGETVQVGGIWSRPLGLFRSSPLAAKGDPHGPGPAGWDPPVDGTPREVFAIFLKNILDFLVATRELTALYSTRPLLDAHMNVWSAMRKAQRVVDQ